VETVTFHSTPAEFPEKTFTPLATLYAANFLSRPLETRGPRRKFRILFVLPGHRLEHRIEAWKKLLVTLQAQPDS